MGILLTKGVGTEGEGGGVNQRGFVQRGGTDICTQKRISRPGVANPSKEKGYVKRGM